jgi:DNA-directed RNA polymerase subunit H (RpoH/RPB5)
MSLTSRDAILNSFKTIKEMFETRNRQDISDHLSKISNVELDEIIRTRHVFTFDIDAKLRILYYLEPKLKVAEVKSALFAGDDTFESYLIVIRDKTSVANTKSMLDLATNVQVFELKELQFNISTHVMVPKHKLIDSTDEQINGILQKLNIKSRAQLPVILKSDPMAKFLNAKPGDMVEITRYSPTSGQHIFYRICV